MTIESKEQNMELSRDVTSFLGVQGLRAKVYSVHDPKTPDSLVEIATPDLSSLGKYGSPFGSYATMYSRLYHA